MIENIYKEFLVELKECESKYFDPNGEPLKNLIVEDALKLEPLLIKTILSMPKVKEQFVTDIEGVMVFDKVKFQSFINNKEFLPDSYTKFSNKIGLEHKGEFISKSKDVSLVWPYKDCILQGGQTKEDEKRSEIFFNEILAPDQINRLKDPKVFTNIKYYDTEGEKTGAEAIEKIDSIENQNLIIKGNNLLALYSLLKVYEGKIKLIYIDPPYNTGNDSFGYNDSFNHSTWLTFFQNRISVAKRLLSNNGSIWMNLDDSEVHYAKVICDEIFGRENFIANVVWQKKFSPQNDAKFFSDNHDHILIFAKNSKYYKLNLLPRSSEMDKRYENPDNDCRGPWTSGDLLVKTYSEEYDYPITSPSGRVVNPPNGSCWRVSKKRFEELKSDNRIWFGEENNNVPRLKRFLSEVKQGITPMTIWTYKEVGHNQDARRELFALVDDNTFKTPKPEGLVKRIIELGSNKGDIVLDFFSGSGTSGSVALKMNRRFINCEQMDYCDSVTVQRIQKTIKGELGGISKEYNWQGGGSFLYLELMKHNQKYIEAIEKIESGDELLKIWEMIKTDAHLNYRTSVEEFEKNLDEFTTLAIETQKKILCEILNKNDLYVNLSEIDDKNSNVGEIDKKFNKLFYGV